MRTLLNEVWLRLRLLLLSGVLALILWTLVLEVFQVSDLVGRRPWQVASFLFEGAAADGNRMVLMQNLGVTLGDFGAGYLVGLGIALLLAIGFSTSAALENVVMPTAMVLRCIPVIVVTPLITLIFGIGVIAVTAIVTLVVFLPALANVLASLRRAQAQHGDLIRGFGGRPIDLLRKVALPFSVPALMTSALISIPAAMTGALIGEWLATGQGIGGFISRAAGSFAYDAMWASAVAITIVTTVIYSAAGVLEALIRSRFAVSAP